MYEQALQSLKEAFPTVDPVVVEAILDSHRGNADQCFEPLLRISDPSYKPDPPQRRPSQPLPTEQTARTQEAPKQEAPAELTPEEQMRRDEDFARQLALEDERERVRLYQRQQQQQQRGNQRPPGPERDNSQGMLSSFEQELPVIKERMMEAGTAAKNKMMQWYNQMKETSQQSSQNTMPPTNARYRGLSRDEHDDLLSGDMSALHLSENDVYNRTTGQAFPQRQNTTDTSEWDDRLERRRPGQQSPNSNSIQVNPPVGGPRQPPFKTSTSIEQLNADEELARRLAYADDYPSTSPPAMPARPSSQSPPQANLSPVHSPVQSPTAQMSPPSRSIEVNPRESEDEEYAQPYTISPKAPSPKEATNEPLKPDENIQKELLASQDEDFGLVDVEDDDDEDEELESHKALKAKQEK
ncbi:hypothetical protein BC943DRAFT_383725 [Umbelopsis sp. AD052]|nr:hypothetical protein BC943DRAFT_383725 [Umbelopsis sp. AD052]